MTKNLSTGSVHYAVADSTILERVAILGTVIFPPWGKYILYRQIDWPDSLPQPPFCVHESTFSLLYTPQEPSCENIPSENSSSKIFSPPQPRWFTELLAQWTAVISFLRKAW